MHFQYWRVFYDVVKLERSVGNHFDIGYSTILTRVLQRAIKYGKATINYVSELLWKKRQYPTLR
jgi:hypothetical protein